MADTSTIDVAQLLREISEELTDIARQEHKLQLRKNEALSRLTSLQRIGVDDFTEPVKQPKKKRGPTKFNTKEIIQKTVEYLEKMERPATTGEIIDEALGLGRVPLTVRNTISSRLYAEAQLKNGKIVKAGRGIFELRTENDIV